MGLAKRIGKNKAPKPKLSAKARVVRKAYRDAQIVSQRGVADAEKIQVNVLRAMVGASYMYFAHIMHVQEKISCKVICQMINGIQKKMACVTDKLTSWEDIEEYEIKSTDPEFYSIKWLDYHKVEHNYEYMLNTIPAKTLPEMISAVTKTEVIRYAEFITHHFELAVMSALHDYFGYGLKRLKRIITAFRKLLYLSKDKLHGIIEIVRGWKLFDPDETDTSILAKHERYWSICLLDKEWEGNFLKGAA